MIDQGAANTNGNHAFLLVTVVSAGRKAMWPGAGSNRRPSDFQSPCGCIAGYCGESFRGSLYQLTCGLLPTRLDQPSSRSSRP
jgi:hypothetical protein